MVVSTMIKWANCFDRERIYRCNTSRLKILYFFSLMTEFRMTRGVKKSLNFFDRLPWPFKDNWNFRIKQQIQSTWYDCAMLLAVGNLCISAIKQSRSNKSSVAIFNHPRWNWHAYQWFTIHTDYCLIIALWIVFILYTDKSLGALTFVMLSFLFL